MARWKVHGERSLHESDTVRLALADVELADGTRIDHYVIRIPFDVVSLVLADDVAEVRKLIAEGQVDGLSLTSLLWALEAERLA